MDDRIFMLTAEQLADLSDAGITVAGAIVTTPDVLVFGVEHSPDPTQPALPPPPKGAQWKRELRGRGRR